MEQPALVELPFLRWQDTNVKRPPAQKVAHALQRFRDRRNSEPRVIYVHPSFGLATYDGVEVVVDHQRPRNTVDVG